MLREYTSRTKPRREYRSLSKSDRIAPATMQHFRETFQGVHSPHTRADFLCQPFATTVQPQFLQQTHPNIALVKARLALPRGKHLIIRSWSACLPAPAPLSMLRLGRCLLRSIETSTSRFYCASRSHYSTLSSSHREQVTVPCRSNGHITLRQVVVVVNSFDSCIPQRIFHKYCWLA